MKRLLSYLPKRTYGLASAYRNGDLIALISGVTILEDDSLFLRFPKVNPFAPGDRITIHLDNRTGIDHYSAELHVYRSSYKGFVTEIGATGIRVSPEEYTLFYGSRAILEFKAQGFSHPSDNRSPIELATEDTSIEGASVYRAPQPDARENDNKLGVWVTRAVDRPHTTVMAFLSSEEDDIFIISHPSSFKSSLIHRDPRCLFAIDHRANYHFEKRFEWNYTIIRSIARRIEVADPRFDTIQALFVEKNPWERLFFTDPKMELFHLEPLEILCPEKIEGARCMD